MNAFKSLITAVTYFYFNWRYFALVSESLQIPRLGKLPVAGSFILNYGLFYVCSVLELNLIFNWALFFLLLFFETRLYCGKRWRSPLFFSLMGILCGLVINIFCRCAVAIAISQPLSDFDNHVSSVENLKVLPVMLGFLLGGIVLHLLTRPAVLGELRTLIGHPGHLSFQLELMGGMFLYLFLNLLLYQSEDNSLLMKLWGVKSCVFSVAGTYLGMRYSLKMCRLSDYRDQNRVIQRQLLQKEREEARLYAAAYSDPLTGAYNRQSAVESINRMLGQKSLFTLCFMDLDNLKGINDVYGHAEGDRYLVTVARELERTCRKDRDLLFRYGGDEFLILFTDACAAVAEQRIQLVNQRLGQLSHGEEFPYAMGVSYGAVEAAGAADAESLIQEADGKMYRQKRKNKLPPGDPAE